MKKFRHYMQESLTPLMTQEIYGMPINFYKNLTGSQVARAAKETSYGRIRFMGSLKKKTWYIWDGGKATHSDAIKSLQVSEFDQKIFGAVQIKSGKVIGIDTLSIGPYIGSMPYQVWDQLNGVLEEFVGMTQKLLWKVGPSTIDFLESRFDVFKRQGGIESKSPQTQEEWNAYIQGLGFYK